MTKTTRSPSFAATVPLAATAAYGLGPFSPPGRAVKPQDLKPTEQGLWTAIHAAGRTGRQLLSVLSIFRDGLSEDALAFEAAKADPDDLAAEIDRLVAARLVERTSGRGRAHGSRLVLTSAAEKLLPPLGSSMSDPNATTSDTLAIFCRRLGITAPSRKQERADAIAACFADPEARAGIWKALSVPARSLLKAIADRGGPGDVTPETVGLSGYDLHLAQPSRYSVHRQRFSSQNAPLAELTYQGIVGANPYEGLLWIWREAWAMLERPLYGSWPSVAEPATAPVTETGTRLPPLLTTTERALQHWDLAPPPVLKNGELRLSKTVVRSTAKALSSDEATIELISLMALSLGLLLPNVARTTGRGRKRTVDEVWMADPDLRAAWSASPATTRWLRMVAEWTDPGSEVDPQLVANRHLVLWELASLPEGVGWANDAGVAAWLEHRYQPVGESEGFAAALVDLRTLGMVTTTGPTALTELGRLALRDPAAVAEADLGSADTAVVQADHTVVCPPDLSSDLAVRLGEIATLESDAGARIYRLDEASITASVQGGDSATTIIEFLESLSSVPVADTVRSLVEDAAGRADRVKVLSATTVVVTTDPADLATATKLKSAKLTAISPTVAVSDLAADKVRQALDRKGLAPLLVTGDGTAPARRSSDDADHLEQQARRHRTLAERHGHQGIAAHAERLEQAAAAARDPSSRLAVTGPLAVTPELVASVVGR